MHHYIINCGSNLGDRRLNLSKAMRAIGMEFGDFEMSHVVESEPAGYDSPHKYLNMSMMFRSELDPEAVLEKLQEIERSISPSPHRNPDGSYADRIIDIDMIAADDLVIDSERLTLPHPRLAERRFFLEPLREIAPGWRHPITGLTPDDMISQLKDI